MEKTGDRCDCCGSKDTGDFLFLPNKFICLDCYIYQRLVIREELEDECKWEQ